MTEQEKIILAINEKYTQMGENPNTYLKGLLQAKPINYWDYKDEGIFIMYHQVTELVFKMMIHEIKQIVYQDDITEEFIVSKINRIKRYTSMLITSYDIMKDGMSYEDYNTFRVTLAPASGFQSAQFRYLEIYCTRLENLINAEGKKRISVNPSTEELFENIYWKDAGLNRVTGEKTLTLLQFEEKYLSGFIALAKRIKGKTIEDKILQMLNPSKELCEKLKEFDCLYNVEWPLVHLNTAKHYLDKKGENKAATGGSEWKKYLHPRFQQRKFFPSLWTEDEITNWGN